jgi:hypothetical protein
MKSSTEGAVQTVPSVHLRKMEALVRIKISQVSILIICSLIFLAACSALPDNSIDPFSIPTEGSSNPIHTVETQSSSLLTSFSNLETTTVTVLSETQLQGFATATIL